MIYLFDCSIISFFILLYLQPAIPSSSAGAYSSLYAQIVRRYHPPRSYIPTMWYALERHITLYPSRFSFCTTARRVRPHASSKSNYKKGDRVFAWSWNAEGRESATQPGISEMKNRFGNQGAELLERECVEKVKGCRKSWNINPYWTPC